ncbi:glycosyltransferase family 2 protein [Candidatus Pelagibacter sp.]|uniref:glycosyltransferase family 2 protein n=1 Tax=Candidatus Pelagibacter sp. TaxID=2024849 RepID=UPI003F85669F
MKVTIITVCYNSEKTIEKTIKSVLSQNYKDYEYIIIDGGSTDNTINIVNKYKKKIDIFKSEKDRGIYDAINKGINHSTGSIISILHSDDVFCDKLTINKVISNFKSNQKIDCLIGNTVITKKNSKKKLRKYNANFFKNWMLYLGFSPPHPSTFFKQKIYKKYGLYNNKYTIAGDFEFFVRVFLKKKLSFKIINENFVLMKTGGKSSNSFRSNLIASKEIIKSFKDNNLYTNWFLVSLRFPLKLFQYIN